MATGQRWEEDWLQSRSACVCRRATRADLLFYFLDIAGVVAASDEGRGAHKDGLHPHLGHYAKRTNNLRKELTLCHRLVYGTGFCGSVANKVLRNICGPVMVVRNVQLDATPV